MALDCPEPELLLWCARISSDSSRAEQLRALFHKDLDWAVLRRIAHQHGVVPFVYWRLSNTCLEAVPTAVLDRLRGDIHANSLRNLSLTRELLRLLNLFEVQGIFAISYRGPALAAFACGNLALRQFADLDILVRKHDAPRAKEVFISAGYRSEYRLTRTQEAALCSIQT